MEGLVKGDIIVVEFPFSDLKASKRRPVLVIKVPKGRDIIAAQITGSSYNSLVEVKINETDFKNGGLKRESFVRMDKISSIEKSLIKYVAGSLKPEKFNQILEWICSFLRS